jgi:methionine aminopeptidase
VALLVLLFPRARGAALLGFALSLLAAAGLFTVLSSTVPIALFALLSLVGILAAAVLVRLLPRLFIALFAVAALPFAGLASEGRTGVAFAGIGFLAVLYLAVKQPQPLFRLSCASLAALAFAPLLPEAHALLFRCLAALALLGIELLGERALPSPPRTPLPLRTHAKLGAILGALAALVILLLPALAQPLAAPIASDHPELQPLPYPERRAQLERDAPRGGLVWPLPSEALTWDEPNLDRALFPRFDNLDALFLGMRTRGLLAIDGPATSPGTGSERPPDRTPLRWLRASVSLHKPIAAMRLQHDPAALARLRLAAQATVAALNDVLPMIHPGATEASLEAALKNAMGRHGCGPESFPLIFASGASAAEPHGSGNLGTLKEGELLVADIGCTVDHYASDFTRTLPVSGKFTERQKLLYENVFLAQAAALAKCKPGAQLDRGGRGESLEDTARAFLKSRAPDHDAHMPHSLGHSVGLFVHDIYASAPLEPGNVITLEPGTYLPGKLGIRIEDTFVVTRDGCEALTSGFPAEADAVEARMRTSEAPRGLGQ